jgi:tetratricopeptide (TPR) repeat protein
MLRLVKLRLTLAGGLLAGTAKGKHSRSGYVELVFAIHNGRHSGRLKITHGRRSREVFFIAGRPVLYDSNLPDEALVRTLAYTDMIPEDRLKWIADKLSPGENIEEALVMSGSLSQEAIDDHVRSRTKPGIAGALTWSSGTWIFEALPATVADGFDPRLLGEETALPSLWNGVNKHVGTDEVLPAVTAGNKGGLQLNKAGEALLPAIGLTGPFSKIAQAIGSGASVEDVFRAIPDNSGGLFKLLWMLESGGVVQRENSTGSGEMAKALRKAESGSSDVPSIPEVPKASDAAFTKGSAAKATPAENKGIDVNAEIAKSHAERMGKDFYEFLGLKPACPRKDVDKACKDLAQDWRTAESTAGLTEEARKQIKDLLAGVQLAWRTLTDPKHKREYDRRLDMGRAPIVEIRVSRGPANLPQKASAGPSGKKQSPTKPTEQSTEETNAAKGRNLLNRNEFASAVKVLESARVDSPSDPAVLADLGWARWKARQWGKNEDEPEEFLRLALTFEPKNGRALEFLARINIDKGETEKAQKILQRILKITPGSDWARSALLSQQKGQRSETVTRRGFWRGKGGKS